MSNFYDFDLIVIGSGSAGSTAAEVAVKLGKNVAVFESGDLGGECPNWACIPTKALLHAAQVYQTVKNSGKFGVKAAGAELDYQRLHDWKNLVVSRTNAAGLEKTFRELGITLVKAKAEFISDHEVVARNKTYSAEKFLISTGSEVSIPPIEGLISSGYITFREAVDFKKLPKSIFILGGGPIGCELAQIFSILGSKVYLAEGLRQLLPREEPEVGQLVKDLFEKAGVEVFTNCQVTKIARREKEKLVYFQFVGKDQVVNVDQVLVATGKKPVLDPGLDKIGVASDKNTLEVNGFLQTSLPHIFAAGDSVGPYLFTHTANYQGQIAAQNAFKRRKIKVDYKVVPRCVFTIPEVASVGLTEAEAKAKKLKVKTALVPISVLGRANTANSFEGLVKIVAGTDGEILGAAIVSPHAGEMIHEIALAMQLGATAADIAGMIHAYPTYSEAIKIACENLE